LLVPFRAMVDKQISYASQSPRGRHRLRRRKQARTPACLPQLLAEPSLLCVTGESNAWAHDRALGRPPHPHELVHWVAARNGQRLEELIAPRKPLSRSPMVHARLPEEAVRGGTSLAALRERWAAFVRPDDVICSWGDYASGLFEAEGLSLGERRVDIRKVAGDLLKKRPGSLEELTAELGLAHAPLGLGRAGERLGMLVAVTEWLAEKARPDAAPCSPESGAHALQ
jgi:hypothetical protein